MPKSAWAVLLVFHCIRDEAFCTAYGQERVCDAPLQVAATIL